VELKPGRVLLSEKDIVERVSRLAEEINADYGGMPVAIVGVLDGCLIFLADLIRRFEMPLEVVLLKVKTYDDADRPQRPPEIPRKELSGVADRHVLVVDDIYDSGATLSMLVGEIEKAGAADTKVCVLLEKERAHEGVVALDYRGFLIPDVFVVGYGLDFAGLYRNLPYVAVLEGRDEGPSVA
jgi:hypoxanthine phosphoribosyltransferase